jgi:iron complex outermembrane receptor protein
MKSFDHRSWARRKTSIALSVLALSTRALANDAVNGAVESTNDGGSLVEIVVTAEKRSENLERVPVAVTAFTAGELAGSDIEGQLTLPKLTPNLNFTVIASFAAAYIRGVGTGFANPGLESSVPVYLDDVYLPRAASGIFDFNDLDRIEVLKGPQGTLYGRNATGGAIRIVTNDPQLGVLDGSGELLYGSEDRIKYGAVANLPLGSTAALRLAVEHDQDDGYIRNFAPSRPGMVGDRNEGMYTAKLLLAPNDALHIKISADYETKNDNEGMTFQNVFKAPQQLGPLFGGCVSTNFYNLCNEDPGLGDHVTAGGVSGRIDYDIGPNMLSSITAYRSETENDFADVDATGADIQETHGTPETRQLTEELQLVSNGAGSLRYIAGFYFLHERAQYHYDAYGAAVDEELGSVGTALGFGDTPLDFREEGTGILTNSYAPYAQADYTLNDQFSVEGGLRYTVERKTLLENVGGLGEINAQGYYVPGTFIGAITGACAIEGQVLCSQSGTSLKSNQLTPKLTFSYKPDDHNLGYVSASRGFKSGGFNLPAFGFVDKVDPETLNDFELGWKYDGARVRFNGAAFFYDYRNLQVQIIDPVTAATYDRNGADAHIYGLEGDVNWLLSERFELNAGWGYLHARYTSFPDGNVYVANDTTPACAVSPAACVGNSFPDKNLAGNALVNAPKLTAYVRPQYTLPEGDFGKLIFSGIVNYRAKTYFDVGNQLPDESRTLLSARIQWVSRDARWSVAVDGENLTGKEYYLSRVVEASGGFQVPAPPRQGYVSANVKF